MRINAINTGYPKQTLINKNKKYNIKRELPTEQLQNDTVAFKGIKNALRGGGLGVLAGAFVGSLFCPGLGSAAGAAMMAAIVGGVGAAGGAMESDENNILKD